MHIVLNCSKSVYDKWHRIRVRKNKFQSNFAWYPCRRSLVPGPCFKLLIPGPCHRYLVPVAGSSSLFQVVDSWSLRSKLTLPVPPCFESTPPQSKDDSIDSDACERISRHVCKLITEQTMHITVFPRRIKIKVIIKHERNIFWCQFVFWSWEQSDNI